MYSLKNEYKGIVCGANDSFIKLSNGDFKIAIKNVKESEYLTQKACKDLDFRLQFAGYYLKHVKSNAIPKTEKYGIIITTTSIIHGKEHKSPEEIIRIEDSLFDESREKMANYINLISIFFNFRFYLIGGEMSVKIRWNSTDSENYKHDLRTEPPFKEYIKDSRKKCDITDEKVKSFKKFYKKFMTKPPEKIVSISLRMYNDSLLCRNIPDLFITLTIILEMLMVNSNNEIMYRTSRNTAVFIGVNKEECSSIFKKIKELYDKRSKYAHQGSTEQITYNDLNILNDYVRRIIIKYIELGKTKESILNELNECGFGQY